MALSIKDEDTDALVRRLAKARKLSYTAAIKLAVSNELMNGSPPKKDPEKVLAAIREIQKQVAKLPQRMTAEEMDSWMYDENGLPH